ncbi:EAL domain-containing protein [Aquibacillus sediminis]|uniref:EAL domain-containing protein n=1 Tax=Aquibacillus sediminis TaxID=2574734 RepID=UPI001108ED68|nr:EAL domain-containing protein [Aquibacillus sediminis]
MFKIKPSIKRLLPKGKQSSQSNDDPLTDESQLTGLIKHISQENEEYNTLTQLPNRYYSREAIKKWIHEHEQKQKSFACFYINVDGLNQVNTNFGYEVGDVVLKKTAEKMKQVMNEKGVLFHIGSDEFIALVKHLPNQADYYQFAQQVVKATELPIKIASYDVYITLSVGISVFSVDSVDHHSLVSNAHTALKYSKQTGKGSYQIYAPNKNIESFKLFQLENDIRHALSKQQIYIEYQPRISPITERVLGAEALIRWDHPEWGVISPAEFIPVAEANVKVLQQIDDFLLRSVCEQINTWQQQGISQTVISINLSPKRFMMTDLVDKIESYIREFKISPAMLEIEVTEGALLPSKKIVEQHLKRLQAIGVCIALDDYGTGYSNVQYLKQFPIDTIKIDREFTRHIADNEQDAIIIKSIIDLAKGLNKRVVAEGIETKDQLDMIKKFKCDEIQGYLYSESVDSEQMGEFFRKQIIPPKQPQVQPRRERRQYFRVQLPFSLRTQMTILSFNDKPVSLGSSEVFVQDIGLGGLRFLTHLRLKSHENIVYGFNTTIMNTNIHLSGKIVWQEENGKESFEYGVEFMIEESDRDVLAKLLNDMSVKIKQNPAFNEGDFVIE